MLIPLGTDRPLHRPTVVTYWLIGVNVAIFLAQIIAERVADPIQFTDALMSVWLDPAALTVHGFITYQFLHGGLLHLLGNMLFLYVFGPNVEDRFGRIGFLAFYLIGGVAAGGLHVAFDEAPVIGASGSIAGVTGAFLVLFPRTHVRTLLFFFLIGVFMIPAWWFIVFAIARDLLFQGLGNSGVAHLAHLGGYGYGFGVAWALLAAKILPREPAYDLFSMRRQAKRRREFKELTSKGADPWRGVNSKRPGPVASSDARAQAREEQIAEHRRNVAAALASGEMDQAVHAYMEMTRAHPGAGMHRDAQLQIANELHGRDQREAAARAYEVFLARHGRDREAARVGLMLALLYARYLGRPGDAAKLLEAHQGRLTSDDERALASSLLREVGVNADGAT